ncbi:hypothetical protein [Maritimibacter sp. DP1N21-5]|uniref:hypothetical protein n=1 Tax=Maritimibacter sp. DP1N21-5 TaxID=2836867 RepID=UPI001C465656|nr:hypothetical protein [Maritimibacter sp. DP1N21-5]MBV7409849.1 hypothetical protein [Maritimibacter sp. DP1N21-5]
MNFNPRHFIRMSKWARNPPNARQVKLFFIVLGLCLVLFGIDRVIGWPEWLTVDGTPSGKINR